MPKFTLSVNKIQSYYAESAWITQEVHKISRCFLKTLHCQENNFNCVFWPQRLHFVSGKQSKKVPKWLYLRKSNIQNGNLRWIFPWRGGGSRVPHTYSEKWFFWKPFRIIPWLWKRVLHLVWALYYVYIVVEMTLNMAK